MKNILLEFKKFALRGNVIDLAVGIIIGASFNGVVKSLVDDVLLPPIGWILGRVDFSNLYISLSKTHYDSLAAAKSAGIATINYGLFINTMISFLVTAWAVFILVRLINRLQEDKDKEEEAKKPATPEDILLLRDIRDSLKK